MVEENNKLEKIENEDEEDEEDKRIDRILCKAVAVQALYAVYEDRFDWDIMLVIDDLEGFGKTVINIPKDCLNKQRLLEFIEEIKKKEV
jgi:hypothetical protein